MIKFGTQARNTVRLLNTVYTSLTIWANSILISSSQTSGARQEGRQISSNEQVLISLRLAMSVLLFEMRHRLVLFLPILRSFHIWRWCSVRLYIDKPSCRRYLFVVSQWIRGTLAVITEGQFYLQVRASSWISLSGIQGLLVWSSDSHDWYVLFKQKTVWTVRGHSGEHIGGLMLDSSPLEDFINQIH